MLDFSLGQSSSTWPFTIPDSIAQVMDFLPWDLCCFCIYQNIRIRTLIGAFEIECPLALIIYTLRKKEQKRHSGGTFGEVQQFNIKVLMCSTYIYIEVLKYTP